MKEKIYYYAFEPKKEDVEATLKYFMNKYDWKGLIELNPNLENILKEIINKLIWYKSYEDEIRKKTNKKLTQKEINQKYTEFVDRLKDEVRNVMRYLDISPINLYLPNTSPSILKELEELEDVLKKDFKFTKTKINKILQLLGQSQINLYIPNTSPSILKELEDVLKEDFKFTKTTINKILQPLKEFSNVENLRANESYEFKRCLKGKPRRNTKKLSKKHT